MDIKVEYIIHSEDIYKPIDDEKEILVEGTYGDRRFVIMRNGGIGTACAYIESIPTDYAFELAAENQDRQDEVIEYYEGYVHGGYTYYGTAHWDETGEDKKMYAGWDYAHYGDYSSSPWLNFPDEGQHKWTISEILEDVRSAYEGITKQNLEGGGAIEDEQK